MFRGGLTFKFGKFSTNLQCFIYRLGGLELCFGGLSPSKHPRGDGAVPESYLSRQSHKPAVSGSGVATIWTECPNVHLDRMSKWTECPNGQNVQPFGQNVQRGRQKNCLKEYFVESSSKIF